LKPRERLLDLAGGSGDLVRLFAKDVGPEGELWLTDINPSMLQVGRDRLVNAGILCPALLCDAEKLPFPSNYFDVVTCAFGLRNMTHKERALSEMQRVLRPGGRAIILEFSKVWGPVKPLYDAYSFNVLPLLGKYVANDEASYRYLAESIRMHPDQETLKMMMADAGLAKAEYFNLTGGVVALHRGFKY
jgi:demethylmenaquinone methyltransferase / 2-methoxy-6-polyprenyl-1,4-benzoquinol methylase